MVEDYAYAVDWVRRFGRAVLKGRWEGVRELAYGRARVTWEFPTMGDLKRAMEHVNALSAMAAEDAAADGDLDALRAIVVRYHRDDDGE